MATAKAEFTVTSVPAPGRMHVDWEERVDFRRLHDFLDRSSFITAIGEFFQGRLQDVLTRGGIGGQHGLTGR